ncbi:MAG TPA: site-specific integrase [Bacteroidales bacterium]|nr:site-specific integrase [Bacteroidales bacterium]
MSYSFHFEVHHVRRTDKEYPILLRITIDRKHKRITLPITVSNKSLFNGRARRGNWIRIADPDHESKNDKLMDKLREYHEAAEGIRKKKIEITFNNLIYAAGNNNSEDIFVFTDKQKARLKKQERFNYLKHYTSVVKRLKEYTIRTYGTEELKFTDLSVGFLRDYEAYLSSIGNKTNTIGKNLKIIRAIYNDAIEEDLATPESNPFLKFKIKREQTDNKSLTVAELQKFMKLELPNDSFDWNTKNAFMFSYYCAGIRVSDLLLLKWTNIKNGRLEYTMSKNGKTQTIKLNRKAKHILSIYAKKKYKDEDYIFPFLSNEKINDPELLLKKTSSKNAMINTSLKRLAIKGGIDERLSFHMARHTFSDIARQRGGNLYAISKALNHSRLATTEAYLASFDQKAVDELIDKL